MVADESAAIVGSANLTPSGFGSNIELIRVLEGIETKEFLTAVSLLRPNLSPVSLEQLRGFVGQCVELADERDAYLVLGRQVASLQPLAKPLAFNVKDFIDFCRQNPCYLSRKAIEIRTGQDVTNRTGHITQAFYAVQRFFQGYPEHIRAISRAPIEEDFDPRTFQQAYDDWKCFLEEFISEEGLEYRMASLKMNLTPTFGGTRMGGGGWDPPFKIVWPLVARMMGPTT